MRSPPAYLGAATVFTAVQTTTALAIMTPPVLAVVALGQLGLDSGWIGVYPAIVFTAAMLTAGLGGGLVARYGAIRVTQIALVFCGAGLGLVATAELPLVVVGAALMGLGYGPGAPASSHVLALLTPVERRPLVFSIKQSGVPAGGILAGLIVPPLVLALGWQGAALMVTAAAISLAVLIQGARRFDGDRNRSGGSGLEIKPALRLVAHERPLRILAIGCLPLIASAVLPRRLLGAVLGRRGRSGTDRRRPGALDRAGCGPRRAHSVGRTGRALRARLVCHGRAQSAGHGVRGGDSPGRRIMAARRDRRDRGRVWCDGGRVERRFPLRGRPGAPPGAVSRATGAAALMVFAGAAGGPPLFGVLMAAAGSYAAGFVALAVATGLGAVGFLRTGPAARGEKLPPAKRAGAATGKS